ncbi:MAG: Gfo/Idh/MocA family oxidoreductase [Spirochaetaceae bacterium]|nr:Gfo/Idh/MocA family oxidoreductase [Spirochaetaceae bacterium]
MNKIKIAIIGCGIITSEAHLPALKRLKNRLEVLAVCNRSEGKAMAVAKELDLPQSAVWTDWQKMIKEVNGLDAVLIALPITMNYPVSKACCEAGLSVICEKPAGKNVEEAEDTGFFTSKYNVTYLTAENYQYEPKFNKAAELVKKGTIGKLHSSNWNLLSFMDKNNKFNKTSWRAHNKYEGGYVLDGGVHFVHALQMIAGPVKSVFAHTASIEEDLGTMDSALTLLKHENNVISSLNMGWRSANDDGNLKLFGEKGTLIVKDDVIIELDENNEKKEHHFEKEDSFYLQWCDFLNALESGKPPLMPIGAPTRDVKVIMAVIESGKTGTEITI